MEKCDICNNQFSNHLNLRKHIKNIYKKINFKFEICAKEFSQKENLQRLKLSVHSKSSEFECIVCKRKFTRKENLLAHKNICCKCRYCHEQFFPIGASKSCLPGKKYN